ncbi:uncharacterized protein LOC128746028 [Sabethes cyaneus]|uniref:uncharacterized protein LOC128746028 n=1 Tax=Sabethes cyaneus TaxID=53552 RepID=UPI00237E3017|nr:uncharacterized protein LOC128746028 [Sabethes cyaneus]
MEAPSGHDTVKPSAVLHEPACNNVIVSCQQSHPGPVSGGLEGAFQPAISGKYLCIPDFSRPDVCRNFRRTVDSILEDPVESSASSSLTVAKGSSRNVTSPTPAEIPHPDRPISTSCMSSATEESLLLYYQNACGMNTVIDDYLLAISEGFYDVIALTETWLDDRTLQSQLLGHEYEGFRCDRGPHNSSKKTGGGVLVAVRRSLKASRVNDVAWNNIEQVWVSIKLKDRNLYLCTIYIPPDRTRDKTLIESHLNSVLMIAAKAKPRDEIVIIGDFNFPNICWRAFRNGFTYPDPDHSSFHTCALDLLDGYSCSNLIQINCNANENGRCLDLCFVSASESAPRLTIAPVPLVKLVPHHPPLVLSLHNSQRPDYHETPPPSSYNFRQADYNGLLLALQNFNWSIVLLQHDINIAVSEFSLLMNQLIERFVPKSRSTPSKHPPWQTPELRRLKTVKRGIFRKLSANRNLHLREHYQHLNHAYRRLSRRCHRNYTRRMEAKLKSDPKRFWKFVNQQRKESSLPTTLEFAGETADNTPAICRLFATKFSSVFCNETLTSSQIDTAANNVIPPVAQSHLLISTTVLYSLQLPK